MFKTARLAKIKEVILDRGHVNVSTLSSLLSVSEVTIRSDLEQLEKEHFVQRTRGGAILNEDYQRYTAASSIFTGVEYSREKEYIAGIAADMVNDSEWVFIGQGTTCCHVAQALAKKSHVRAVTNNLYAAAAFSSSPDTQVILTGGALVHSHLYTSGDLFMQNTQNLHFSRAFIGVSGISIKGGITVEGASEVFIINKIREICDELIIVADYTKFGKTAFMRVGAMSFPNAIITNENIPENYKAFCFENNIQLFTSYEIPKSSVRGGEASL